MSLRPRTLHTGAKLLGLDNSRVEAESSPRDEHPGQLPILKNLKLHGMWEMVRGRAQKRRSLLGISSGRNIMASVFRAILLIPLVFAVLAFAQKDVAARELRPGVPVEGTIRYSQSDTYFSTSTQLLRLKSNWNRAGTISRSWDRRLKRRPLKSMPEKVDPNHC